MGALMDLVKRWKASHPGRAWAHYNGERGPILAGGLAYVALFSVFSILLVGFTALGVVIDRVPGLQARVVTAVNASVPNLLKTSGGTGAIDPDSLFTTDLLSGAGIIAFVLALLSGLGWIDALREGVRAMFGVPKEQLSPVAQRLRDLLGLVTFGGAVLLSAALSVGVNAVAGPLLGLIGFDSGSTLGALLLKALSVAVVFFVDAAIFAVLLRVLAHLPIPWRDLREASFVGAGAIGVLKLFAGTLVGSAGGSNPLLASAGVIVGLLVWMNLVCRVVLVTAAWAATDPQVLAAITADEGPRVLGPQVGPAALGSASAVAAASRPYAQPSFGVRAADRTTIAAGVVLGTLAAAGAGAAGRGVRALRGALSSSR